MIMTVGGNLAVMLMLLVAGCTFLPPSDGEGAGGGLPAIMQRYHVEPLDPNSTKLLVKQTLEELEKTDLLRRYKGTTYRLTYGNRLPHDWILQTPNVWGKAAADVPFFPVDCANCDPDLALPSCVSPPDCGGGGSRCVPLAASVSVPGRSPRKFCVGHSDASIDLFYNLIASARQSVDIAMLQPAADLRFRAAIRNAITWLAFSGRAVTIRAIVGSHPPTGFDTAAFLRELTRDAAAAPNSRISVYAAAVRPCDGISECGSLSWNHAKIVAVDGRKVIVGGHNLWTSDYLASDPVHDISMIVEGSAARDGHRFADALWGAVCTRPRQDKVNDTYAYLGGAQFDVEECPTTIALPPEDDQNGGVPILAVGRLASGIASSFADQSLIARELMFGAATHSIRMLQQDVAFAVLGSAVERTWPESALADIADLMARKGGDVYLILSNPGAAGPVGNYSNGVPIEAVGQKIHDAVRASTGMADQELSALLCQHLHLAPLRFGPDATWPDGQPIGTHAKFWMVDERVFYIGSENLYPTALQEFGYIVEDKSAVAELRRSYWDKAWKWSRAAAISGDDAPSCMFTAK
jgi:phosphatidylserine/phosphatidylglycerophosphate/cardiolipin synthase-like enzyme